MDQFITLDNLSTYGTAERLRARADCVAISLDRRYIEEHSSCLRTDIQWKPQIPQIFCREHWSLCVDADEFFHARILNFSELSRHPEAKGASAIAAAMIGFYSASIAQWKNLGVSKRGLNCWSAIHISVPTGIRGGKLETFDLPFSMAQLGSLCLKSLTSATQLHQAGWRYQ